MSIVAKVSETAKKTQPPADLPPAVTGSLNGSSGVSGGRKSSIKQIAAVLTGIAVLGIGAYAGEKYWTDWRFQISTDDAYVQADSVAIAPQVAGNVATLLVTDNQSVKAGQVLAVIDQRDYQAAVDQAKAGVDLAQAAIATTQAQLAQQQAIVAEAQATMDADKAAETFAEQNNQRYGALAKDGFGSVQNAQQALSQIGSAKATVAKDEAAIAAAEKAVATLSAQIDQAKATLAQNEAVLRQAQINLGYTTITAPVDGVIGARTVRAGQYVQPGTQLLAIVPLNATYVVGNFKETQLAGVQPGQPVALEVDEFPDASVRGFVNSLAPATGQEFALLPPDNATGNFTKIVQRIPVKITLDPTDPLAGKLRPGMSVTPTIDIRRPASNPGHGR